jgi:hypothetical protein
MHARMWLVVAAACGPHDAPTAPPPPAPVAPPRDAAAAVVSIDAGPAKAYVVASYADDRIGTYTVAKTGVTRGPQASIGEDIASAIWLDRDHLAVVGVSGQVYRVSGATVERYKMPRKSAWRAGKTTATRAEFPNKVIVVDDGSAGPMVASCVTYEVGDDDPCVDWKAAPLRPNLVVGRPRAIANDPTGDRGEPHAEVEQPDGIALEIGSSGSAIDVACTTGGDTTHRSWAQNEPCPVDGKAVRWVSAAPPIVDIILTTNCGEGGDHAHENILRACALTDVLGDGGDNTDLSAVAWGDDLWAIDDGTAWRVRVGDRDVGTIERGQLLAAP